MTRTQRQPKPPSARRPAGGRVWAAALWAAFTAGAATLPAHSHAQNAASRPAVAVISSGPASLPAGATLSEQILILTGESAVERKKSAAAALAAMKTPEGLDALVKILERKNDESAKLAICQALAEAQTQEPALLSPLLALLRHKEPAVQKAAAAALAAYRDPQVQVTLQAYQQRQRETLLINELKITSKLLYDRLNETEQPAFMLACLQSPLAVKREIALDILHLGLNKSDKPPPELLQKARTLAADAEPSVRLKVVEFLRDLRQLDDAPRLRAMLEREKADQVRGAIYHALGLLEDPASIPVCIQGLKEQDEEVAAMAADALGKLAELKTGVSRELLAAAVQGLTERAAGPITAPSLRENLLDALSRIADPKTLKLLADFAGANESSPAIRKAALRGLGRIGDGTVIPLVIERLTADPAEDVREAAAEALGRVGNSVNHLRPLRDRLDPKIEQSPVVQKKAWEAYRAIFIKLPFQEQQPILDTWPAPEQAAAAWRTELLADWEKSLSAANGDRSRLALIREQLGEALSAAGRPAEAAGAYASAFEIISDEQPDWRVRVAAKLIQAHLRTPTPEQAVAFAAKVRLVQVRAAVAAGLLKYVQDCGRSNPEAARAFLTKLKAAVPDQFGPPWAAQFEQEQKALTPSTLPASAPAPTPPI